MKVIQPYRVVSTDGTAQVQCFIQHCDHQIQPLCDQSLSYLSPEELRVTLVKGLHITQEICSSIPNFTEQKERDVKKRGEVNVCYI